MLIAFDSKSSTGAISKDRRFSTLNQKEVENVNFAVQSLLDQLTREGETVERIKWIRPPYSKDRNQQLCYKCGKYCSRTLNMCPNCDNK